MMAYFIDAKDYKKIDEFIKSNMEATYGQFRKQHPNLKISASQFRRRGIKIKTGTLNTTRSTKKDYAVLYDFIKRLGEESTYTKFKDAYPDFDISDTWFMVCKKKVLGGDNLRTSKSSHGSIDYTIIEDFLKKDPMATYKDFKKEYPKFKISDAMYYNYRRKRNGLTAAPSTVARRSQTKIYVQMWSMDAEELKKMPVVDAIKAFVDSMNKTMNTRMEIVELLNPNVIEVREAKK